MGARNDPTQIADRAKSNGFKTGRYLGEDQKIGLRKYDKGTENGQDQVLHVYAVWAWTELNKRNAAFKEYEKIVLCQGATLPATHELKDFWRFYKDQAKGRIVDRPTAKSLKGSAKKFNAGFKRRTGNEVHPDIVEEINHWIGTVLTAEEGSGVTTVERPKYNYKPVDLDKNLKALWGRSDIQFRHERDRFQVHFLLLIFCHSGARRGGLFKAGIPYKDIHLVLDRQNGIPRLFFELDQRTVKNNKDPTNRRFGITGREHRLLRYNAVFFLLHFAIADGALDHGHFMEIMNGKGDGPIEWNEEAQELPICRRVDKRGLVTRDPMTFSVFEAALKKLFMCEYNFDRASMHMIRRELGKQLDNRYTETERSQHVLHADPQIFGQSYVAFVSSCDGFAAFMREDSDHTAVEYFQGLDRFWQPGLPLKLPAAQRAKVERDAELAIYDSKVRGAVSQEEKTEAKQARGYALKRLKEKALQEYREECFKRLQKDRLINGCAAITSTVDPLNTVIPEKQRVSEAMVSDATDFSVMKDALWLLTLSSEKYYRHGEAPQDGLCPYCRADVSTLPLRNVHTHHCRRATSAKELGVLFSTLTFCYFCNEFLTPPEWEQDCQRHLSDALAHCGSFTYRHTLVRPAFCLLCVQSKRLAAADRLHYFERDVKALEHITKHHGWRWTCLCCDFVSDGEESGRSHLYDAHGYQFPRCRVEAKPEVERNFSLDKLHGNKSHYENKKAEPLNVPEFLGYEDTLDPALLHKDIDQWPAQTHPPELSDDSDEVVNGLMTDWISFPKTPPSEPPTQGLRYIEVDPTLDQVDCRAPYYLLPSLLDTGYTEGQKEDQKSDSPETPEEIKWEYPSELDYVQSEEQPVCFTEPPTGAQIVIELRSAPTREEYHCFESTSSVTSEKRSLPQVNEGRIRLKFYSSSSSPSSTLQKRRLRTPGMKRAGARFTSDEDRLLIRLKSSPNKLTWQEIYQQFNIEFPGRRSLGTLQVHCSTKLKARY